MLEKEERNCVLNLNVHRLELVKEGARKPTYLKSESFSIYSDYPAGGTDTVRKEMDNWNFCREGESEHDFLARFFIAIDELRARLDPGTYPNLEISDEGYLWFNIPSSLGMLEIFALPYGIGPLPECALALSFPHDPVDLKVNLAEILWEIATEFSDVHYLAAYASAKEIMKAYNASRLPELHYLKEIGKISTTGEKVDFFSYFGLWFSVRERDVLTAETLIREILSHFEKSVALQKGK